jgi:hypothetical protein
MFMQGLVTLTYMIYTIYILNIILIYIIMYIIIYLRPYTRLGMDGTCKCKLINTYLENRLLMLKTMFFMPFSARTTQENKLVVTGNHVSINILLDYFI